MIPYLRPQTYLAMCSLRGVVDMGSNGIRFSVTDLSQPRSRILPTVHVYRVDVSLYDAQFDRGTGKQIPIPRNVIEEVIAALNRFKIVCADFGVSDANIHVLATEATRTAINSTEFISAINSRTGLTVNMLRKEEEGRIGALGVASGFSEIKGLMMDLGGGSTQITWIMSRGGNLRISHKGSISLPYGAAALTRTIEQLKRGKSKEDADKALAALRQEMVANFIDAYAKIRVPDCLVAKAKAEGGFPLYLSGGGFRGWGYLLLHMSQVSEYPHPISIINGYTVGKERFANTKAMEEVARTAHSVFRVSDRRRKQVPAIAFLINVLHHAIPYGIRTAHFCQGGVREGFLFRELEPSIRAQDPLEVATRLVAPQSAHAIWRLLMDSFPESSQTGAPRFPDAITPFVIQAFANMLYVHAVMEKELASTSALYSTSTGLLSVTRGVSHEDRARLALMLESRYMGELPPREVQFREALRRVITAEEVWWAAYLGRVGYLIGRLYPSGRIDESKPRISLSSEWAWDLGRKKRREGVRLIISVQKVKHDPTKLKETLRDHVGIVEKVGKKKNWVGGQDGWGMKVEVKVVQEDNL
ncbi:Ppx/GppA phosphatase family-domain-containing protein [Cladorrhinum sp. PSN259]|nr:Ppx/GppA phosphatase family-domain-containing protein [Cladorrhinum sp. PSN259]